MLKVSPNAKAIKYIHTLRVHVRSHYIMKKQLGIIQQRVTRAFITHLPHEGYVKAQYIRSLSFALA